MYVAQVVTYADSGIDLKQENANAIMLSREIQYIMPVEVKMIAGHRSLNGGYRSSLTASFA